MKKFSNKKKVLLFSCILTTVTIIIIIFLLNPLWQPAPLIRANMLNLTPKDTSMEEVIRVIKENWEWEGYIADVGYLRQDVTPRVRIGEKSIKVFQGKYPFVIFYTYVTVYYGFDENDKLIDIWVWKDTPVL